MRAERVGLMMGLLAGVLVQLVACCPSQKDLVPLELSGAYDVTRSEPDVDLENGPVLVNVNDATLSAEVPQEGGGTLTVVWRFVDEEAFDEAGGCSSWRCDTSDTSDTGL